MRRLLGAVVLLFLFSCTHATASIIVTPGKKEGTPASIGALAKKENLKDVESISASRTNLGLGTAATEPSTAFFPVFGHRTEGTIVAFGSTLPSLTSGVEDVSFGTGNFTALTSGNKNVAVGPNAASALTEGNGNTAVGRGTMSNLKLGENNVAIGNLAMQESGGEVNQNVAIGTAAMKKINAAPGPFNPEELPKTNEGRFNVAIGQEAMNNALNAYDSVAIGAHALFKDTSGFFNVAVGEGASEKNTEGSLNTAVGTGALREATTASKNTAVGYFAAYGSEGASEKIVGMGYRTLRFMKEATGTTALGFESGVKAEKNSNTFVGAESALGGNPEESVAVGRSSMLNSSAAKSVAVGVEAMSAAGASTNNTAMGWRALTGDTTGEGNVAFGYKTGTKIKTGEKNVFIGNEAGSELAAAESNKLYIANSNTNSPLIAGDFSAKTVTVNGSLSITTGLTLPSEVLETAAYKKESITAAKLGPESVEASKIKAEAVGTTAIANLGVTAAKLAAESVETAKIKLLAVTAATLATEAVETGKIKAEAVTAGLIKKEAVGTEQIGAKAVVESKLATTVTEKLLKVGSYGARVERTKGTEIEPSATEPTQVILEINCKTLTETSIEVKVGGTLLPKTDCGSGTVTVTPRANMTFIVPAGKKYEVVTAANIETVFSSYLAL